MKNMPPFKRIIIALFLCVTGIVFPPLFILAAFFAWTVFDDWNHSKLTDAAGPPINILTVTADHANWKSYYLSACESPAEEAFLNAMILGYDLSPTKGVLTSSNLALEMQVEINRYRVDFIANKWLIIEVDGAAYHSSPDAIAKDKVRDSCLMDDGYTVLRIPAKIVFQKPKQAVSNVRAALAVGRVPKDHEIETRLPWTVVRSLSLVRKTIADIDTFVTTTSTVQKAMIKPNAAFEAEKNAIEFALDEARTTLKTEAFCRESEQHAELFADAYDELAKLVDVGNLSSGGTLVVPEFEPPIRYPDATANDAIAREFGQLSKLRSDFFDEAKMQLSLDPRMPELVRTALEDIGSANCWKQIST